MGDHEVGGLDRDWLSMLIFNNRKRGMTRGDDLRYLALAEEIIIECVKNFNQYLDADVPCQKLTEGLEGLYYALVSSMGRADLLWPRVDLDLTQKVRSNTGRVNVDQWWARLEAGRGSYSFDPH